MASVIRVTWHGAPETEARLARAISETADDIADRAMKNVEKQGLVLYREDRSPMLSESVIVKSGASRFEKVITTPAWWGFFSEYGTSREPARPWFRPALKWGRSRLRARLKSIV